MLGSVSLCEVLLFSLWTLAYICRGVYVELKGWGNKLPDKTGYIRVNGTTLLQTVSTDYGWYIVVLDEQGETVLDKYTWAYRYAVEAPACLQDPEGMNVTFTSLPDCVIVLGVSAGDIYFARGCTKYSLAALGVDVEHNYQIYNSGKVFVGVKSRPEVVQQHWVDWESGPAYLNTTIQDNMTCAGAPMTSDSWSNWSECDLSERQYRNKSCIEDLTCNSTGSSNGTGDSTVESRPCNYTGCIQLGQWSNWQEESGVCGQYKVYNRKCEGDTDPHLCQGQAWRAEECDQDSWTAWNSWSDCSTVCGTGYQNRSRECLDFNHDNLASCIGNNIDFSECQEETQCIQDNWTDWGSWSSCSSLCGSGHQIRQRTCMDLNQDNTAGCVGIDSESMDCSGIVCTTDNCNCTIVQWSSWQDWSPCSTTCDSGYRIRQRHCEEPSGNVTKLCLGNRQDLTGCRIKNCTQGEKAASLIAEVPYTESDERVSAQASGAMAIVIITVTAVLTVATDIPLLRYHWKKHLMPNIRTVLSRVGVNLDNEKNTLFSVTKIYPSCDNTE